MDGEPGAVLENVGDVIFAHIKGGSELLKSQILLQMVLDVVKQVLVEA